MNIIFDILCVWERECVWGEKTTTTSFTETYIFHYSCVKKI